MTGPAPRLTDAGGNDEKLEQIEAAARSTTLLACYTVASTWRRSLW